MNKFKPFKFTTAMNGTQHSLRLFGISFWASHIEKGFGWIRIFGIGITWKDITKYRLLFCERNGFRKRLQIGKWTISWLSYHKQIL